MLLKFYVDPERYGEQLAESVAQALHAERAATAQYMIAVGPRRLEQDWGKREEERSVLRKRELDIAQEKGWKEKATTV